MTGIVTVSIHHDGDVDSPRENFDHCDVMYMQHSRYTLGDKDADDPRESKYFVVVDGHVVESSRIADAIDLLDEIAEDMEASGETVGVWTAEGVREVIGELEDCVDNEQELRVKREDVAICLPIYMYDHSGITISHGAFSCPWDSGQVGWHYMTHEALRTEFDGDYAKATKYMEATLEEYDMYLRGEVYGYSITSDNGSIYDSCYGFFGHDPSESGMLDHVDTKWHAAMRAAADASPDYHGVRTARCTEEGEVLED